MRGFTIIESIITIVVVGIMASLILVSYGGLREGVTLNRHINEVSLNVRKAQNLTTSIVKRSDNSIPCGYGIHYIDQYNYILFANFQDGSSSDCSDSNKIYDVSDAIVDEINLENANIKFYNNFSDIVFLPPDPLIFIDGASNPTSQSVISICAINRCASPVRKVTVYGSGLIDIE